MNHLEHAKQMLGAVLLDNRLIEKLPQNFTWPSEVKPIREAMLSLHARGRPIDIITMTEQLSRFGHLEIIGGVGAISRLTDGVPRKAAGVFA